MENKPLRIDNLEYIDSLRWIAILMVLMVHFSQLIPPNIHIPVMLSNFFSFWQYGVMLFFIVSAYTLFRSLNLRNEINFKNFFIMWKISFSLYLIHLFILQFIWPQMSILKELNIFVIFTILISIIMILSYISYYLIEIKFIKIWKYIINKI